MIMVVLASLLSSCALWNDDPYSANVRQLTDADGDGFTLGEGDCNDADPDTHPGATDSCDAADNDCDGAVDEDLPTTVWCADIDGDGFGDGKTQTRTCFPNEGWVQDCSDCDDLARAVHPDAVESCNDLDDDCDGLADPTDAMDAVEWYPDDDGDGFGAPTHSTRSCDQPAGTVQDNSDCDDNHADIHPGATEVCDDGRDNDCDGTPNSCLWGGERGLSTESESFIAGPAIAYEYVGYALGMGDANADGVSDLIIFSSGAMYGEETAGVVHLWYGAPTGPQEIEDAPAHIVGAPDLYLGAATDGPPLLILDEDTKDSPRILVTSQGFSSDFDLAGVVLEVTPGLYGRHDVTPENVFARGQSVMEAFGTTLSESSNAVDGGPSLVIGAPFNSESGSYAGAVYLCRTDSPDATDALATLRGEDDDFFGGTVPTSQDLDGDGVDDIVIGATALGAPAIVVFRGPLQGDYTRENADGTLASSELVADGIVIIPDADGDGTNDLAVAGVNELHLVSGALSGTVSLEEAAEASLTVEGAERVVVGYGLATGDPQADGVPDLAVGMPELDGEAKSGGAVDGGAVAIVPLDHPYKGSSPLLESAAALFLGPDRRGDLGFNIAFGDVNSDGFDDLAVSATGFSSDGAVDAGGVWFILGGGI